MTRKGKLVPSEKHKKQTCYGTQTTRLSTDSQLKFGYCCLQLEPAEDPVSSPSGHIYSREAILSYLLSKTQEIQEQRREYERKLSAQKAVEQSSRAEQDKKRKKEFLVKGHGGVRQDISSHKSTVTAKLQRKIDVETQEEGRNILKRTSYWLTDTSLTTNYTTELPPPPPPERPSSPHTGQSLRLKDLVSLDMKKDGDNFLCAVTEKNISTQPVIVIKKTGQVMLKSVYNELVKPTMICPITGIKFKEKDVLELIKASTGFAASGTVEVKQYIPTLT